MLITNALTVQSKKKPKRFLKELYRDYWLYIFALPGILFFLVFNYAPMFGVVMAFQSFDPVLGFFRSQFTGIENFKIIFSQPEFLNALKNSIFISLLKIIIGYPLGIFFALMLNEIRHVYFKKAVQTITYMPYFISWVIVSGLWYKVLAVDGGVVNDFLMNLHLIDKPIFFFGESKYFYPIVIISDQWKNIGFGSILYLATLAGVNPELYQSASIDGAGRFRKMWHISLPAMRSMIVLFLILSASSLLNAGLDQIWNMRSINMRDVSEIIDTLVLTTLTSSGIFGLSLGASMGLFQATVGLMLFLIANTMARLVKEESIL